MFKSLTRANAVARVANERGPKRALRFVELEKIIEQREQSLLEDAAQLDRATQVLGSHGQRNASSQMRADAFVERMSGTLRAVIVLASRERCGHHAHFRCLMRA